MYLSNHLNKINMAIQKFKKFTKAVQNNLFKKTDTVYKISRELYNYISIQLFLRDKRKDALRLL